MRQVIHRVAFFFGCALSLALLFQVAAAQTYTVIHNFTGPDGATPYGTLTMDRAGNLYGTTYAGGNGCDGNGCGTVFKLTRKNSGWILTLLYTFQGGDDGAIPLAGITIGPDGSLYGTTSAGGGTSCSNFGVPGCGTVFNLKPPVTFCRTVMCPWTETVLYRFTGGGDGAYPGYGKVVFDQAGNLYGTTQGDDNSIQATAFKLSRAVSGWTESLVYNFGLVLVGSGMIFDNAGNLYGTTADGGSGGGTVYELTPSGSAWTQTTLYQFPFQGVNDPLGGVAFDQAGNLYGTTFAGGTAYRLALSDGAWTYSLLFNLNTYNGSFSPPALDADGNVYGVIYFPSMVFKLAPISGGWIETTLYDFLGGSPLPVGGVVLDGNGNVYGTTTDGGTGSCNGGVGCGVVFEIAP
jgi:uncharacterized repeat protein (TIGR03803 family)